MAIFIGMTTQQADRTIDARFEITAWDETIYDKPNDGPKLTRITIQKRYYGEIEGSGRVEVLTAQGDTGAGCVASERVDGTLDGRRGTFVIQHGGLADGTHQSSYGTIIPASGTGELTGIRGHAEEAQQEVLTLAYTL